jgi:hypothetical protein
VQEGGNHMSGGRTGKRGQQCSHERFTAEGGRGVGSTQGCTAGPESGPGGWTQAAQAAHSCTPGDSRGRGAREEPRASATAGTSLEIGVQQVSCLEQCSKTVFNTTQPQLRERKAQRCTSHKSLTAPPLPSHLRHQHSCHGLLLQHIHDNCHQPTSSHLSLRPWLTSCGQQPQHLDSPKA